MADRNLQANEWLQPDKLRAMLASFAAQTGLTWDPQATAPSTTFDYDNDANLWGNIPYGENGANFDIAGIQSQNVYVPGYFSEQKPVLGHPPIMTADLFRKRYLSGFQTFIAQTADFDEQFNYFLDVSVGELEAKLGLFLYPRVIICQPKGTSVTTERGIIDISQVVKGDCVLTHSGKMAFVESVRKKEYNGSMISIRVRGSCDYVRMTPEHLVWAIRTEPCIRTSAPCYAPCREASGKKDGRTKGRGCPTKFFESYKPEFIRADELKVGDIAVHSFDESVLNVDALEDAFISACGENAVDFTARIIQDATNGQILSSEHQKRSLARDEVAYIHQSSFWRLVGYWLGDGTIIPNGISFSFGLEEQWIVDDLASIAGSILNREATPVHFQKYGVNVLGVNVSCSYMRGFFKSLKVSSASSRKCPLTWMERLPSNYQRELLLGYWRADGSVRKNKDGAVEAYMIVSISKDMLESFQRMGWRLGLVSSIGQMKKAGKSMIKGKECDRQALYSIVFGRDFSEVVLGVPNPSPRPQKKKQWIDGRDVHTLITDIKVEGDVSEEVYNFTVDHPDHSYTGNHIATHNCDAVERGFRPGIDFDLEVREQDFVASDFFNWGWSELQYGPIMSITNYNMVYPTGQQILNIPMSWLKPQPLSRQIRIVPPQGALSQVVIGPGGFLVTLLGGQMMDMPALLFPDYIAGIWPLSQQIIHAIAMQTAVHFLEIFSDMASQGMREYSVNAGGVSIMKRFSDPDSRRGAGLAFSPRINQYEKNISQILYDFQNAYFRTSDLFSI